MVGGPRVGVGGSVGVGGTGGVVGSGVEVGSGVSVGLATMVGVAVKVGTKVLVGVAVALGAPNRPPRAGPRSVAANMPRTQNNAAARPRTKNVTGFLLISEFSLPYATDYRWIRVRVQIRYSHNRCGRKQSTPDRVAGMVQVGSARERMADARQLGLFDLMQSDRRVAARRSKAPAANGA